MRGPTGCVASDPFRSVLQFGDLPEPALEGLAAAEPGIEVGADQVQRQPLPDDLRAETEHVGVVVLDRLVGRMHVVAEGRADAGDLVGRDAGADARAADQDPPLRPAAGHGTADRPAGERVPEPRERLEQMFVRKVDGVEVLGEDVGDDVPEAGGDEFAVISKDGV
jgi:hypothetical protein